jgi:hypothetical protein
MPLKTISPADQKAEVSWKNSNPSLDMMLYRMKLNDMVVYTQARKLFGLKGTSIYTALKIN